MPSLAQMERVTSCPTQRSSTVFRQIQPLYSRPHLLSKFTPAATPLLTQRSRSAVCKAASVVGGTELPANYVMYETMIVMRPDMTDEQRDMELAKFEAFLKKQDAHDVNVTVRGRQRLAYPIKRFGEGVYVLYTYAAGPTVSQAVQRMLSTPEAGSELNILRHMTFRV